MREADHAVEVHRVHKNVPPTLGQRTESETRTIRRDARRKRHGTQMSELALIRAVVIHHPDFFVTGAVADKVNLAFRDAGNASTQAENNLISESVRNHPNRVAGWNVGVLFAENLRGG